MKVISSDLFRNTDMDKTRIYIKSCYKDNPRLLFYYLALSYCREENYEKAEKYFISALNAGLKNYLIYYNIGVLHIEKQEYFKAEAYIKKSIELNRQFDKSYINLAYIYYETGDIKRAYRTIKSGTIYANCRELKNLEEKLLFKINALL